MDIKTVTLANAKAHLSELTERVSQGESVIVTKHGRSVARFVAVEAQYKPIDLPALQALTAQMPLAKEEAGDFMRKARESERY